LTLSYSNSIEKNSLVELIDVAILNYKGEFDDNEEKKFVVPIFNSGGIELLTKIYNSLPNWDSKANLVKYFIRSDCEIEDKTLLKRYQREYYDYLVDQGNIVDYCKI